MEKKKIRDIPIQDFTKGIVYFCTLAGIKQSSPDELEMVAKYIQEQKGSVWSETFRQAFHNFIKGDYPHIRKPYKIDAHFISSIIEAYFSNIASATRDPDKYKDEDEKIWTEEEIERVMREGYELSRKDYFDNNIQITWLAPLYNWMEKKGMIPDFDDETVKERLEWVEEKARNERKTKRGKWDITQKTREWLLKAALVSLAFENG